MRAALRWMVPLLSLIGAGCGPAPYAADDSAGSVKVHMGGSFNSFMGVSNGSR